MKTAPIIISSLQLILCLLLSLHYKIPIVAGQSSSQDCSALDSQPEKTTTMPYEQDGAEAKEIAKYLRK